MNITKNNYLLIFCLCIIWVVAILFTNPIGNFPLNDDFDYAKTVKLYLETNKIQFSDFPTTSLIGHILLGSLFCKVFGYSFTILRFYSLFLSLISIIITYYILILLNRSKSFAFLFTILLMFNPFYYNNSFTFMTESSFMLFSISSIFCFVKYYYKNDTKWIFLGLLVSFYGITIRQPAVIFPISFGLIFIFQRKSFYNFFIGLLIVIISFSILKLLPEFLKNLNIHVSDSYGLQTKHLFYVLFEECSLIKISLNIYIYSIIAILYLALFLSPLILLLFKELNNYYKQYKILFIVVLSLTFIYLLYGLLLLKQWMPLSGNTFINFGLGPTMLRDVYILNLSNWPKLPKIYWIVITIFSFINGVVLILLIFFSSIKNVKKKSFISLYLLMSILIYSLPMFILSFYDRYLIVIYFLLTFYLMYNYKFDSLLFNSISYKNSIFLIIVIVFLSIGGTYDYLSWNRARWKAINYLLHQKKISPTIIDGGFEFNGLYNFSSPKPLIKGKSFWWVNDDMYLISFGNVRNYKVYSKFEYMRIFPFRKDYIYILKRETNM